MTAPGRSVQFVDAPVSGGVNAAAAGTLTFMVGADSEAAFTTAKQILDSMGAKVGMKHCVRCCWRLLVELRFVELREMMIQ